MIDPRLGPEFDGLAGMPFSDQDGSGELAAMKIGASMGSVAGYMVDDGAAIVAPARVGCQYGYGNGFDENSKVWKLFRSRGIVPDYKSMIVVNMLGQRCGNEDLLSNSRSMPKSYEFFSAVYLLTLTAMETQNVTAGLCGLSLTRLLLTATTGIWKKLSTMNTAMRSKLILSRSLRRK